MNKNYLIALICTILLFVLVLSGCAQKNNVSWSEEPVFADAGRSEAARTSGTYVSDRAVYRYEIQELYARRDENRIYGVIYIPQNAGEQMPAIIYSHGLGSAYRYGIQYAEAMAARGYVVYCFDFCGGGPGSRSDGSPLEMSIFTEKKDLEAVISMLQGLGYVDSGNIFLLGASQGGAVSAITAADHRDEIAGTVLLYPAFLMADYARERFDSIKDVPETHQHLYMTVGRAYFENLFDYDIYEAIKNFDKDVLIIHGGVDSVVPLSYSERAVEVYPSARLEVINGAGHGFRGKDAQQAIDYMTEYCNSHLN